MDRTEKIIQYLVNKYAPSVLISYGSFADGSANEGSDYDAILVYDGRECHDGTVIDGTPLDVFCYPAENFSGDYDPEKYIAAFDGKILIDTDSLGQSIKDRVRGFIDSLPKKDTDELLHEIEWCRKMLIRSGRGDAEGFFRWHWVLIDSLEIYFDIIGIGVWTVYDRVEGRDWADVYELRTADCGVSTLDFAPEKGGFHAADAETGQKLC